MCEQGTDDGNDNVITVFKQHQRPGHTQREIQTDIQTYMYTYGHTHRSAAATWAVSSRTSKLHNYSPSNSSSLTVVEPRVGRTMNQLSPSSLSSALSSSCLVPSPVHDVMLLIQSVFGLPRLLAPGIVPWIISFSKHSPPFRMTCPK